MKNKNFEGDIKTKCNVGAWVGKVVAMKGTTGQLVKFENRLYVI